MLNNEIKKSAGPKKQRDSESCETTKRSLRTPKKYKHEVIWTVRSIKICFLSLLMLEASF